MSGIIDAVWDVVVLGGLVAIPWAFIANGRRNRRIRESERRDG